MNHGRARRHAHEHNHCEGRHDDLLQGLGHGSGRHLLARMAVELRCLGWPDVVSRAARLQSRRSRSSRSWPVQPGDVRERHGRIRRRSRGRDRGARSQGHHDGRSLDRRGRSHPLHRSPRDEARFEGCVRSSIACWPSSQAVLARGPRSIHDVPKRSRSIAKRDAKKVSSIFMKICPPSLSRS